MGLAGHRRSEPQPQLLTGKRIWDSQGGLSDRSVQDGLDEVPRRPILQDRFTSLLALLPHRHRRSPFPGSHCTRLRAARLPSYAAAAEGLLSSQAARHNCHAKVHWLARGKHTHCPRRSFKWPLLGCGAAGCCSKARLATPESLGTCRCAIYTWPIRYEHLHQALPVRTSQEPRPPAPLCRNCSTVRSAGITSWRWVGLRPCLKSSAAAFRQAASGEPLSPATPSARWHAMASD
jgi:hypothetical protein